MTTLGANERPRRWRSLIHGGDVEKRLDISVVSARYKEAKASLVEKRARSVVAALLKTEPFSNYSKYVNIHLLNGNIHPNLLGVDQNENQIATSDSGKVMDISKSAPGDDVVLLLTDLKNVRSSALGKVITLGGDGRVDDVFIHEMGHAFGFLADEYVDLGVLQTRSVMMAERYANTTLEPNPALSKWHYWMPKVWSGAHMNLRLPSGHNITHPEGGYYSPKGVFRPEKDCRMRRSKTKDYCVVCAEVLERRFFHFIDPIQEVEPHQKKCTLWANESIELSADVINVKASGGKVGKFVTNWYINGVLSRATDRGQRTFLKLDAKDVSPGRVEVSLKVDFVNGNVRRSQGWLSSVQTWSIRVMDRPKPETKLEQVYRITPGTVFELRHGLDPDILQHVTWRDHPQGARVTREGLRWEVPDDLYGSWRPALVLNVDGEELVFHTTLNSSRRINSKPPLELPSRIDVVRGEPWRWTYEGADRNGDHLSLFVEDAPPEMTFLQSPLSIIWTPHSSQDRVKVEVHLHDGTMASKESVTFDVIDRERPPEDRIKDFSGLRSPSVKLKYLTLANLKHAPLSHQILECTRLLCDENALIAKAAFEHVSSLLSQHESWINVFLDECEPYLWELSDRPQILEKVRSLALILEDQEAFLKRCDQVIAYNKKRGLEY